MNESELAAIINNVPGIVFCVAVEPGENFRFSLVNRAFLEATGLSESQIVGKTVPEVIPSESVPLVLSNYKRAIQTRSTVRWEEASKYPTGLKHGIVAITPIVGHDGKVPRLVGHVFDVTERMKAEAEREQFFKFFTNSLDIMVIVGADGYFKKVNPAALTILGYSESELLSRKFIEFLHPEDVESTLGVFGEVQQGFNPIFFENRYLTKSGEVRWLSWHGQFAASEGLGYATARDITERKKLELDLRGAIDLRDEFMSIASHELKTPLTALHMQLKLLNRIAIKAGAVNDELITELSKDAFSSVQALTGLLDDLLDVTRIRTGKLNIDPREMDLREAVVRSVAEVKTAVNRPMSPITVIADQAVMGRWDPIRVDQILSNLLSNAIKYGNGKPIEVTLKLDPARRVARILVKDQGMGIPQEMQAKIFERFQRAVSSNKITGLGLGLYIVRQIVESHGGTIRVESETGHGSLFIVELPLGERLAEVKAI